MMLALTRQEAMPASRGKIFNASLLTQASHLRWPVFASQRPVPLRGQTKTFEKEHCGEVRCAHERKERVETNRIGDEIFTVTCISFISL
ncbi:hypothetical protein Y697_13735 [Mesotoga sp. BH458_6_3_2_1]|nr:hypothetical protein Y697_13735 [Mesotoga sp. BH458_6_3_2_1]